MIKERETSRTTVISVPEFPNPAIKNPPIACPVIEAERKTPVFQVIAFCSFAFGTTCASITLNIGPVKDRTIPVPNIIT